MQFLHAHNRQFGDAFGIRPFRDEAPNMIESDEEGDDDEGIIPNMQEIPNDDNDNQEGASSVIVSHVISFAFV